jgi:putative ABC transport system permease protein
VLTRDRIELCLTTLRGHKLRTALSVLGIAIGILAVVLLTSIGEGTRRYVLTQFTQFGTNLLSINPGKSKTVGIPGVLGGTTRKLTIEDAEAIRGLAGVETSMPVTVGQARVEHGPRGRSIYVYGVTHEMPETWKFAVGRGSFLPAGDPRRGTPVAVIGPTVKRELFEDESALGRFVRIGGQRFRVIGVMAPKGQMLGIDLDDAAYIPVASAMQLFNLDELWEIDVVFTHASILDRLVGDVRRLLIDRHLGNEDFTIVTQEAMLSVFGKVMNVITMSVGAIAGISLVVGAIGILTMMWIAVGERTAEIGLLRALGATGAQVRGLFLVEAVVLALIGGVGGLAAGLGIAAALRAFVPGLPVQTPPEYVLAAVAVSFATGLAAGVLPARRAAALDPIEALRAE